MAHELEDPQLSASNQGKLLIQNWLASYKNFKRKELDLDNAKIDLEASRDELTQWILPQGANPGEIYCVPYGTDFVQIQVHPNYNVVTMRSSKK